MSFSYGLERGGYKTTAPEQPAGFRYLDIPGRTVSNPIGFAKAFRDSTSFRVLGETLVFELGARETREVFKSVGSQAEGDLLKDPSNRVAKSAVRWAKRAETRLGENGWTDPRWEPSRADIRFLRYESRELTRGRETRPGEGLVDFGYDDRRY